ncbi:phage antirepressor KilAC domain-containing protein [Marinilabilia salmonicolor]|uniref:phage antirepressor KilAC domain-containing protein n=1 Tax=Marinilabilia salmonicolor TaxID=989 RepID=UPI00029AE6C8|nr:phage antirepressor KilAC domain-containing protein [Marinilabilia salmonicolor]
MNKTFTVKGGEFQGETFTDEGLMAWYKELLLLEQMEVKYPVNFDHTWVKFFTEKKNGVKFLKNNYEQGVDYEYFKVDPNMELSSMEISSHKLLKTSIFSQLPDNEHLLQMEGVVNINKLEPFKGRVHGVQNLVLLISLDCYEDIALRRDRGIRDIYKQTFRYTMNHIAQSNIELRLENDDLNKEVNNLDAIVEKAIREKGGYSLKTFSNTFNLDLGRNNLFKQMRLDGFLCTSKSLWNQPLQRFVNMGVLDTLLHEGRSVTYITPKGAEYFFKKYQSN